MKHLEEIQRQLNHLKYELVNVIKYDKENSDVEHIDKMVEQLELINIRITNLSTNLKNIASSKRDEEHSLNKILRNI